MKILKFGGTSVGSAPALKNLKGIVEKSLHAGDKPVVVCSALRGVTNALLAVSADAERGVDFTEKLRESEQFHYTLIREILPLPAQNNLLIAVKIYFNELETILDGVRALGELSAQTKDKIVSYGERLSCTIIANFLAHYGTDTLYTDARDLIVTDNNHGNAYVRRVLTIEKIRNWYAGVGKKTPIVTGFIASSETGKTTTLGRGGSDYTAAILGASLQAEEVEIWTDVDGFLTADPRLVKNAYSLTELSYQEAMELCYFGAKVVYPPTLVPAIGEKIPISVKNTFNPTHPGTLIYQKKNNPDDNVIKGISSIEKICLVNIEGSGMVGMKGFSGRLFSALGHAEINIMLITQASSEYSLSFVVSPDDAEKTREVIAQEFASEIEQKKVDYPQITTQLSIIAIVGENIKNTPGTSGRLFSALGKSGINVHAIAQGSSERNISAVIAQRDLDKALNAVHDDLLLSPVKTFYVLCAGIGNIGGELLAQLHHSARYLRDNYRIAIHIVGIINSRNMLLTDREGIDLSTWKEQLAASAPANMEEFIHRATRLQLPNLVFIDNTSSQQVVDFYEKLFLKNISVVTCNKLGNSSSYAQYKRFKELSQKRGVSFYYETNVGAGLPVIKTLHDLCVSGDKILKIEAILSGTISYIFNRYEGDRTFADVVREAQRLGFTEPDPRNDLNGLDFARKMLILGREMGLPMEMDSVQIASILPEACFKAKTVDEFYEVLAKEEPHFSKLKNEAEQTQRKLRLIGVLEDEKIRISLEMVDKSHAFYSLSGSDNIISFTSARYKDNPLVVKGPGAGSAVTAAGVFADLIRVTSY